jgi:hypothetical protein
MLRRFLCTATLAIALTGVPREVAAEDAPPGAKPLPLKGRVTVREKGSTWYVDGPQVIPKDAELRIAADVRIVGIHKASLEVQGSFEVHGTVDHWVVVRNVDFGPTLAPKGDVHFDMADLHGCSFVPPEGRDFRGHLTIENACLQRDCRVDVRIAEGFVRIMTVESVVPIRVVCAADSKTPPEVSIRTSWLRDVRVEGPCAGTIRSVQTRGVLEARDFTDLVVDGCDVLQSASFLQRAEGTFAGLVLTKCNLLAGAPLVLHRPSGPTTKLEKVKVDKFFFGTSSDKPAVSDKDVAERIRDGADDPGVSVRAFWSKPNERKHLLLDETVRLRIPPPAK